MRYRQVYEAILLGIISLASPGVPARAQSAHFKLRMRDAAKRAYS